MSTPTVKAASAEAALEVHGLTFGYTKAPFLEEVAFAVAKSEMVALLGANGAGKTTTLRVLMGLSRGASGSIEVEGESILDWPAEQIARGYISLVPEGRRLFFDQSVETNLLLGAFHLRRRQDRVRELLADVYELFPKLYGYRKKRAEGLSGGEQQMVAIGRAMMADPRVLMLDEPSLGLAPAVIDTVFQALHELRQRGRAVLLVEQRIEEALALADRAYVLERGAVVLEGDSRELRESPALLNAYLGEEGDDASA